jgi:hypothetical protein
MISTTFLNVLKLKRELMYFICLIGISFDAAVLINLDWDLS